MRLCAWQCNYTRKADPYCNILHYTTIIWYSKKLAAEFGPINKHCRRRSSVWLQLLNCNFNSLSVEVLHQHQEEGGPLEQASGASGASGGRVARSEGRRWWNWWNLRVYPHGSSDWRLGWTGCQQQETSSWFLGNRRNCGDKWIKNKYGWSWKSWSEIKLIIKYLVFQACHVGVGCKSGFNIIYYHYATFMTFWFISLQSNEKNYT